MTDFVPDEPKGKSKLSFVPDKPDAPPEPAADPSAGGGTLSIGPLDTGIQTPEWLDRGLAGAGKAVEDTVRGIGQYTGLESRKDVEDSRERDSALMKTTAGKVGNIAGNIAITAPALAIPGVNTVRGAALLGTALGASQPSTSTRETIMNTGLGGLTGAAGQAVGGKLAQAAKNSLVAREAAATAAKTQNAERDAVWQQARAVGYTAPPTALRPNAANTALESVSGKIATRQGAAARNAEVTNTLTRQDLGIAPNTAITRTVLKGVRKVAGKAYQDVKDALKPGFKSDGYYTQDLDAIQGGIVDLEKAYPGISKQANPDVQALVDSARVATHNGPEAVALSKFLRSQAKSNYRAAFGPNADPGKMALATAQTRVAGALEDLIERTLKNGGQQDLSDAWHAARTTIAKSYQAEGALKGGKISAAKLALQLQRGKPVTGGMGLAARFADHFPEVTMAPKSGVGVSKLAAWGAAMMEGAGIAFHSPGAMLTGAAIAGTPYATRAAILGRAGQRILANPSYRPGMIGTAARQGLRALGTGAQITKGGQPLLMSPEPEPGYARGGLVRLYELKRKLNA